MGKDASLLGLSVDRYGICNAQQDTIFSSLHVLRYLSSLDGVEELKATVFFVFVPFSFYNFKDLPSCYFIELRVYGASAMISFHFSISTLFLESILLARGRGISFFAFIHMYDGVVMQYHSVIKVINILNLKRDIRSDYSYSPTS